MKSEDSRNRHSRFYNAFELIQHPPTEADNYQFASVEVKQLSFRIDGVFLPQGDNPEAPIYRKFGFKAPPKERSGGRLLSDGLSI